MPAGTNSIQNVFLVFIDLQAEKISNGSKYTQMHLDCSSTKPLN